MKITTDYCEFNFTFADLLEKGSHGDSYTRSLMPACPAVLSRRHVRRSFSEDGSFNEVGSL
jgi:hypothetical protein